MVINLKIINITSNGYSDCLELNCPHSGERVTTYLLVRVPYVLRKIIKLFCYITEVAMCVKGCIQKLSS